VNSVRESLGRTITELFGTDRLAFAALQETLLAARIAEAVVSRLPVPLQVPAARQYVREREAADYMGVKVATLRAWRLLRSKNGPPFTRVGRMVMYPMAALEEHMRAGLVPHRD
jgi:Helix-turn-helix domain